MKSSDGEENKIFKKKASIQYMQKDQRKQMLAKIRILESHQTEKLLDSPLLFLNTLSKLKDVHDAHMAELILD